MKATTTYAVIGIGLGLYLLFHSTGLTIGLSILIGYWLAFIIFIIADDHKDKESDDE